MSHQLTWENPVQIGGPMSCDRKGRRGPEADPAAQASASRDLLTWVFLLTHGQLKTLGIL